MERRSTRPNVRARSLRILALVPLLTSCAGSASVSGLLVPRGTQTDQRLDDAVVYLEAEGPLIDRRFPARPDPVSLTFARNSLDPAISVAKVGNWLEMWNADTVFHQPFSRSQGVELDGESVRPNTGVAIRLRSKGLVQIFCQLHDRESAEVLVLESAAWTRPDTAGAFRFPPLPRGHYVVRSWHPRLGEQTVPLEVDRAGPMSVELRY